MDRIFGKLGKRVLVVSHEAPDVDSVACQIALKKFLEHKGHEVFLFVHDKLNDETRKIVEACPEKIFFKKLPVSEFDSLVVVDTNAVPAFLPFLKISKTKFLIDHHAEKKECSAYFDACFTDESVSSCAEILYEFFKKQNFSVDQKLALILCAAIVTDSANFIAARPRTFSTLGELLAKHGLSFSQVLDTITVPMDVSEKIARLKAAQRLRVEKIGRAVVVTTHVSAFEGTAAGALLGLGADVVFVGSANKHACRVAAKCKNWVVDRGFHLGRDIMPHVQQIVGGDAGGHAGAAGCSGTKPENLNKAMQVCVRATRDFLKKTI